MMRTVIRDLTELASIFGALGIFLVLFLVIYALT